MLRTIIAACCMLVVSLASAGELTAPKGKVILTVTGPNIAANSEGGAVFDRDTLLALPQTTVETTTPWHEGMMRFEGPLLTEVMESIGASASTATVTALDDYQIDIPFAEFAQKQPILALTRNGEAMPDDDQGPLFIIYDYDSDPALNTEEIHSHSVWSVSTIKLK